MLMLRTVGSESLKGVDWSFSKESSAGHITALHPYPARFIPAIPEELVRLSSGGKLKILDPFAGCGTTLIAGMDHGHDVVGVDVNGLAHLLQRVYTHPYNDSELSAFKSLIGEIEYALKTTSTAEFNALRELPNIDHWFTVESQTLLAIALDTISRSKNNQYVQDLARIGVSRIIVRISRQKSDTQYVAIQKNQEWDQLVSLVTDSLKVVHREFTKREQPQNSSALVIRGDARVKETYEGVSDVDLIITSPPYPNAYEYWLYHKYRMYWLELDPIWSRTNEIGARPYYSGTGKLDEWDFQRDIAKVLQQLHSVTKPNAVQYWVVGDSVIKGRVVDNSEIIRGACEQTGWKIVDKIERKLSRTRSSFQGIGRQDGEEILVMEKSS